MLTQQTGGILRWFSHIGFRNGVVCLPPFIFSSVSFFYQIMTMNNLENSASPTDSQVSPKEKQNNSSYWLSPEKIKALHEDAKQGMEEIRALMKERERKESKAK